MEKRAEVGGHSYNWVKLLEHGFQTVEFFPERHTFVQWCPYLWEPQVSLPLLPPLSLLHTPFPSFWKEGVWLLGHSHPLSLFIVPSHDLLSHRPRLVLKHRDGPAQPATPLLPAVYSEFPFPSSSCGSASLRLALLEETRMEIETDVGRPVG